MDSLLGLPSQCLHRQTDSCRGTLHQSQQQQKRAASPSSPHSSCTVLPAGLCKMACVVSLAASLLSNPVALAYETNTPYSKMQSQKMDMGLLNGKIRPCPSTINPNCISTSSMNATYGIPMVIPPESLETAARKLLSAIQATQRNPKVLQMEDTATGRFLQVEVDGLFGRDVVEFLVKHDVVTYRSLAEKVLYIYPFTTPITDFGAQEKRIKAIEQELGWTVPTWDSDY
ncbi:hypothetical protein L7F22_023049 [Adiantum nelumboides]|nr:hypothetical protein [Adiantum nelumboides]